MTAMDTEPQNEKQVRGSDYLVFRKLPDGTWQELGTEFANGAALAKKQAIETHHLHDEIEEGRLTIAAIGARFWQPSTPSVTTKKSVNL
jgi:hypothetical protein